MNYKAGSTQSRQRPVLTRRRPLSLAAMRNTVISQGPTRPCMQPGGSTPFRVLWSPPRNSKAKIPGATAIRVPHLPREFCCCCSKFHFCPITVANSGNDLHGSKLKNTIGTTNTRPIQKGCHLHCINNRLLSEPQENVLLWNPPPLRRSPTVAMSGLFILY